jgi:hypothetical protein
VRSPAQRRLGLWEWNRLNARELLVGRWDASHVRWPGWAGVALSSTSMYEMLSLEARRGEGVMWLARKLRQCGQQGWWSHQATCCIYNGQGRSRWVGRDFLVHGPLWHSKIGCDYCWQCGSIDDKQQVRVSGNLKENIMYKKSHVVSFANPELTTSVACCAG